MARRVDAYVLWARAAALGGVAFFMGVSAHLTADGLLPGLPFLAGLLAFSVLMSGPLLARPASTTRIVVLLAGWQTFIHLCLSLTAGHVGDPVTRVAVTLPTAGPATLPVVDGRRVGSLLDAYAHGGPDVPAGSLTLPVAHLIDDVTAHAPMMVAHLAAAVVVGLWMGYGERCLWHLIAVTGRRLVLAGWTVVPVARADTTSRAAGTMPVGPRSRWLVRPDSRRGPPLLALA